MADIFLSYVREDRKKAETLAEALQSEGWSVWWDRQIPVGRKWDEVIEDALSNTRCIIVLFSKQSVLSDWVRSEWINKINDSKTSHPHN